MAAASPYALGRFCAHTDFGPRADVFTGVIIEPQAAPLAALLPAAPDLDALLADWPANFRLLGDAVDESRAGQRWASLARPVSDFTRLAPLRPGDLLLTGSPAGNGAPYGRYLRPGDIMEATVTGPHVDLGPQHNRCVAS